MEYFVIIMEDFMNKKKFIMAVALISSVLVCTACNENENTNSSKDLKIGFICEQNADFTDDFNKAIEASEISKSKVVQKTDVTEENCYDTAVELVEQGCNLIFASGDSFEDYIVQSAMENPDVEFCFANGSQAGTSNIENYHNYAVAESESRYISGVVAGEKLNDMISNGEIPNFDIKIGYIGSVSGAENTSAYTAFYLGVKSVCPNAVMEVQYAGLDNNAELEEIAARALIANGSVLIAQYSDTNGAAKVCEENNIYFVGDTESVTDIAPNFAVTSSTYDWSSCYTYAIDCIKESKSIPTEWSKGYETSACGITEINKSAFTSEEKLENTKKAVSDAEKDLKEKTLYVFDTSTFSVNGKAVTTTVSDEFSSEYFGVEYIGDGHFKEYELSSNPRFMFRIDGITELN